MFKLMIATALAFVAAFPASGAETRHKALQILADVGPGGAPMRNAKYGERATKLLNEAVSSIGLGIGDTLTLRTFGNPSLIDQLQIPDWNREIALAYRSNRPEDVPEFLANRVSALSKLTPQAQSDLMFALDELVPRPPCETHDVTTIVLTNGIEVGAVANNRYTLSNIPKEGVFCGDLIVIGFWSIDPTPVPGLRSEAEKLFVSVASDLGFKGRVDIKR